jgi:hypothetical protein
MKLAKVKIKLRVRPGSRFRVVTRAEGQELYVYLSNKNPDRTAPRSGWITIKVQPARVIHVIDHNGQEIATLRPKLRRATNWVLIGATGGAAALMLILAATRR